MGRDLKKDSEWLLAHPVQARFILIGITILILEIAGLISQGTQWFAHWFSQHYYLPEDF